MPESRNANSATERVVNGTSRLIRAFRALPHERRLAAYASIGLFVALFLPWYQETVVAVSTKPQTASTSVTGWGAFSFVEAALLLVAVGVLTLLFQRAEGRAFHLPGGDGGVITVAGVWTCALIVWRIFDKQSVDVHGPGTSVSGIEWGIFVALGVALFLTYAGSRIRAAHRPEPSLPVEHVGPPEGNEPIAARPLARTAPPPRDDEAETQRLEPRDDQAETRRLEPRNDEAETRRLKPRGDEAETLRLTPGDQLTIPFDEG
jgi:hypothetical protein